MIQALKNAPFLSLFVAFFAMMGGSIFLLGNANAGEAKPAKVKTIKFATPPDYVGVWKYSGADFRSVRYLSLYPQTNGDFLRGASVFVDEAGEYRDAPYGSLEHFEAQIPSWYHYSNPALEEFTRGGKSDCNFLLLNQSFPLAQMKVRKAIDAELEPDLLQHSLKLQPDQVTFFEAARTLEDKEVIELFGNIPEHSRLKEPEPKTEPSEADFHEYCAQFANDEPCEAEIKKTREKIDRLHAAEAAERARKFYDVKSASAWIVSGQSPSGLHALPLENFGEGYTLIHPIDRRQYPLIWEVGRAAQIANGDSNLVLQAALLQIQAEVSLLHGNLNDAYIFAHSLDAAHTQLYHQTYQMTDHSKYTNGRADQTLVVSVVKMMERLGMQNTVDGTRISLAKLQLNRQTLKQVAYSFRAGQIQFRDFSHLNALGNLQARGHPISPPVSTDESRAFEKGARDPSQYRGFWDSPEYRMDFLYDRMQRYYLHDQNNYSTYYARSYDHDNYVRAAHCSRCGEYRWGDRGARDEISGSASQLSGGHRNDGSESRGSSFFASPQFGFFSEGRSFPGRVDGRLAKRRHLF
jgi:hypothetical protein